MFEAAKWTLAALSLLGVVLNIHKRRECFIVWAFTNLSWTVVDLYHQIWSQAVLMLIYCGLAVYGLWKWRKQLPVAGGES